MTKKFKVCAIANCGGYSETIYAGYYWIFDTEPDAAAFIEREEQESALKLHEKSKETGLYVMQIQFTPRYTNFCIEEVYVRAESQATAWLREHGNKFESLPLTEISQGWKIAEWGGGPIDFKAPTLPAGAWSHEPDEKGNFVIRFSDGSFFNAKIQKP